MDKCNYLFKPTNQAKIGWILLFVAISFMAILTYGEYDAFFPRNISWFTDIIYFGSGGGINEIGYQSFAAIFCITLGISPYYLLVAPIFLFPLFIIAYLLGWRISGNPILSALVVSSVFCYSFVSTTFLLQIHSHGLVLTFLFIFIWILYFSKKVAAIEGFGKSYNIFPYIICSVLVLTVTNYSSYNSMAQLSLLVFVITGVMLITSFRNRIYHIISRYHYPIISFFLLAIYSGVLVFIFGSFYKVFFEFVANMSSNGVSLLDKLFPRNTLSPDSSVESALSDSLINETISPNVDTSFPLIVDEILSASVLLPYYLVNESTGPTLPGVVRYVIILILLIIYGIWLLNHYLKKRDVSPIDCLIISFLIIIGIYIFIRAVFIANFTYTLMLYPSMLILFRLWSFKGSFSFVKIVRILSIGFIIFSMIMVVGYVIPDAFDGEPNMIDAHPQTVQMGEWSYQYSTNSIATDVYSEGTMRMSLAINHLLWSPDANRFAVFAEKGRKEILSLIHPERSGGNRDLVINYPLPYISAATSDWVTLIPWSRYEDRISWSGGYNVVCTNGGVEYMTPISLNCLSL